MQKNKGLWQHPCCVSGSTHTQDSSQSSSQACAECAHAVKDPAQWLYRKNQQQDDSKSWHRGRIASVKNMMLLFSFFLKKEEGTPHDSPSPKETLWRVSAGAKPPALEEQGTWTVCTSCPHAQPLGRTRVQVWIWQVTAGSCRVSQNAGNPWHPTSSCVATQAPFPILENTWTGR